MPLKGSLNVPRIFNTLIANNPDVADRMTFQGHDFFQPQSLTAAGKKVDVFFLKHVLHDWPEKYAVKILQTLLPALKSDGRILVCDSIILPQEHDHNLPHTARKAMATADMQMLISFNAQERTEEIWTRLVQKADPKLRICNMQTVPGVMLVLMELAMAK